MASVNMAFAAPITRVKKPSAGSAAVREQGRLFQGSEGGSADRAKPAAKVGKVGRVQSSTHQHPRAEKSPRTARPSSAGRAIPRGRPPPSPLDREGGDHSGNGGDGNDDGGDGCGGGEGKDQPAPITFGHDKENVPQLSNVPFSPSPSTPNHQQQTQAADAPRPPTGLFDSSPHPLAQSTPLTARGGAGAMPERLQSLLARAVACNQDLTRVNVRYCERHDLFRPFFFGGVVQRSGA